MEITVKTRLKDILEIPEFTKFRRYLFWMDGPAGWVAKQARMESFDKMWNAASMCGGLDYIQKLCREGKRIFYPLYDEEEAKSHPDLKEEMMFHFPVDKKQKFVVMCAGGGYGAVCSMVEAFPTAKQLNELGYHVFVVNYRVGKYAKAPNPQDDLAKAVRYILEHAQELNVRKEDYAVAGFSAGGHLAASFGTERLGYVHYGLPKPGALFLAYPVITMGEYGHDGSRENLLGKERARSEEWIYKYSIEKQVTKHFPPSFVWQCENDSEVPVENSRMLVNALEKQGIDYMYRTYPGDAHGWGCGDGTPAEGWVKNAVQFWEAQL